MVRPAPTNRRRRVLVATGDTLGARMAGPAIRAWQIATSLSATHEVRLLATGGVTPGAPSCPFSVEPADPADLERAARWADVVIHQGSVLVDTDIYGLEVPVVADAYDPMHLEQLEQGRDVGGRHWSASVSGSVAVLSAQLLRADFILCASEKQRDLWLGHLGALGRINTATYYDDPSLRSLIDVVPFGLPDEPPELPASGTRLRTSVPGVGDDDEVLLWGGGIYNWFDPLTLIRAVAALRTERPRLRLVFMGLRHPNPQIPQMQMAVDAERLASELGVNGTSVLFNRDWIPYEERAGFLLDADIGVSTHFDHLETAFSFRTRILDYLWAGLPVVSTAGDGFAPIIEEHGLGIVVPPRDVDALVDALRVLLSDDERRREARAAVAAYAPRLRWSKALGSLEAFCANPRRAPDLLHPTYGPALRRRLKQVVAEAQPSGPFPVRAWRAAQADWRQGGARQVALHLRDRVTKRRS